MEVKNDRVVTWPEAKKILLEKEKQKELGYEQKNALEHLRKFCKMSEKNFKEIKEELKKIEKLNERQITNIINLLPQNLDELRVIFANERIVLSEEDKKKILDIVKKFG
jgi:DNA-directed RNA polymerase subunit F